MSGMNYCERLMDGVAVEFFPMGSMISRVREKGKANSEIKTVYSVSNTHGLVKAEDFRDNTIHSEDTSNYTIVRSGMFAYNPARLNIGSIAFLKTDTPGLVSPMYVVFSVDEKIISKEYLNLFLETSFCTNKINSLTEEGARFRFDFERWDLIDVPVPPLDVQTEIVRILDAFAELTTELTTELTARKKQYNYYRDQLLSFEEGKVEWKALGEICENISSGKNKDKSDIGIYPVYGSTGVIGRTNNKVYEKEQILIARVGANAGRVNIAQGEYDVSDNTLIVKNKENIKLKYLADSSSKRNAL